MRPVPRAARLLTGTSLVAAIAASLTTLLWGGSFPAPMPAPAVNGVLAEARGWSAVTLLLAAPILLRAMRADARQGGSVRGRVTWLGALAYLLYTYLEFAVAPPFTALFLLYVIAFACALPALVLVAISIDVVELPSTFSRAPRRAVVVYAILTSTALVLAWGRDIAARSWAGQFGWPDASGAVRHVVHALDLGLQVPLGFATAALLLRRRPSGYLVGGVFMTMALCMSAALTAMVGAAHIAAGTPAFDALPFGVFSAGTAVLAHAFFRPDGQEWPARPRRTPSRWARVARLWLVLGGLLALLLFGFRPWYARWGATEEEAARELPGDSIVPAAAHVETRAITVAAPASTVWPWIAQLGQDRAGFYSYALLENLVGCRMPSADRVHPEWQAWRAGDQLWMYPKTAIHGLGGAPLRAFEPERALGFGTWKVGSPHEDPNDGSWSFVVEPLTAASSRLLVRGRAAGGGDGPLARAFDAVVFGPMHFTMERKMMRTLRSLAEGGTPTPVADDLEVTAWTLVALAFLGAVLTALRAVSANRGLLLVGATGVVFQLLTFLQPGAAVALTAACALSALTFGWPLSLHAARAVASGLRVRRCRARVHRAGVTA